MTGAAGQDEPRVPSGETAPGASLSSASIRRQLDQILASRFFSSSKRNSGLLTYLVENALDGRAGILKERTIGIEVFGRPLDYDSSTDHVVRTAAGELRKRLAQYYQEPGRELELRIEVSPGSYVPRFKPPLEGAVPVLPGIGLPDPARAAHPAPAHDPRRLMRLAIPAVILMAALAVALTWIGRPRNAVDRFWAPLIASDRPVLLCIGDLSRTSTDPYEPEAQLRPPSSSHPQTLGEFAHLFSQRVFAADAITLARIAGAFEQRRKAVRILTQSDTTLEDLRSEPAVLIGVASNDWTGRLTGKERFSMKTEPPSRFVIRDRQNPSRADWYVDFGTPYAQFSRDYAIVSRVQNPTTEQAVVLVGGVFWFGNLAAAEFLTNPQYLKKLDAYAPAGWSGGNLEVVLSVEVIQGKIGAPQIVAAHFW